jgi:alpha-beta hydrolase superfamily lysophospholipase
MGEGAVRSALFVDHETRRRRRRRRLRFLVLAVAIWAALNGLAAAVLLHPRWVASYLHFEDLAPPGGVGPREQVFHAITSDGLKIVGSEYAPEDPRGVVLLFHGYGGTRFRRLARVVAEWGYAAIAIDFRAHGESEGERTTIGLLERLDVEATAAEARAKRPGLPIAAWGLSLGGAAIVYAGETTRTFDALVLEAVYADWDSAFWIRAKRGLPGPLSALAYPAKVLAEKAAGLDPERMRPAEAVRALDPTRLLLVGGGADRLCPPENLAALAAAAPGAQVKTIAGADHHDLWTVGGAAYLEEVRAFLAQRFRRR